MASMRGRMLVKKPSCDLIKLSCTFVPSIVMLSAPLGRPFTDDWRGRPVVCTPGRKVTRSSASRDEKGSSVIWRPVIDWPTVAVCVCNSSPPAPVIVTVSVGAPTSSATEMLEGWPTSTLTPVRLALLKPAISMVTV
jgi:hypothetical protein